MEQFNAEDRGFIEQLIEAGIPSFDEQLALLDIAKKCIREKGLPAGKLGILPGAIIGALYTSIGGPVTILGATGGAVTGLLSGLLIGSVKCYNLTTSQRDELRKYAKALPIN